MCRDYRLNGGPQDGARVRLPTRRVPVFIWVGAKWLSDGYAAYTTDGPCERFPCEYEENTQGGYEFRRYVMEPPPNRQEKETFGDDFNPPITDLSPAEIDDDQPSDPPRGDAGNE